jgi:hypothetical protein
MMDRAAQNDYLQSIADGDDPVAHLKKMRFIVQTQKTNGNVTRINATD